MAVFPKATRALLITTDAAGAWRTSGAELSDGQLLRVRQSLGRALPTISATACFIPHHRFRFFDGDDREVGHVDVCFCCANVSSTPDLVADGPLHLTADYEALGAVVRELGSSTEADCDE